jgi:outer membrane protein assembly factor BamB
MKPSSRALKKPAVFCYFLFACLLLSGMSAASPSITLSRKTGPPTIRILVSGSGFDPNADVDIFFGTKDEALVVTNSQGAFEKAKIHAPRSARPGEHWITARERDNDKAAQKPFLVRTNWRQFHRRDMTRLNRYENVLDPKSVGNLELKWSYMPGSSVFSSPAVVNDVVYVGADDYSVNALNALTGAKLWSYATEVATSPAVAKGVVYIGSWDGNLYALNAHSGAKLWNYSIGDVYSDPAVANGAVYVGSADGNVYALNARTGILLWRYQTGKTVSASPAVADGVVYVSSWNGVVYALNAATGAELWSYGTGNEAGSSPSVANGMVYIASQNYNVYALNAETGAKLWSYSTGNPVYSSTAVADGVVYVGTGSSIYALNTQTGALKWSYETGNCCEESSPAVANGVVYVGSADAKVYALNAHTGTLLWSYQTGDTVGSSPAIANGVVYVGSDDGKVYAFGLPRNDRVEEGSAARPDLKTLRSDFSLKVSHEFPTRQGIVK